MAKCYHHIFLRTIGVAVSDLRIPIVIPFVSNAKSTFETLTWSWLVIPAVLLSGFIGSLSSQSVSCLVSSEFSDCAPQHVERHLQIWNTGWWRLLNNLDLWPLACLFGIARNYGKNMVFVSVMTAFLSDLRLLRFQSMSDVKALVLSHHNG